MSDRLIRLPEVISRTGLSRPSIYRLMKDKSFPSNVAISIRSMAWSELAVQNWVDSKIAMIAN